MRGRVRSAVLRPEGTRQHGAGGARAPAGARGARARRVCTARSDMGLLSSVGVADPRRAGAGHGRWESTVHTVGHGQGKGVPFPINKLTG
eukprot:3027363-Prymnesium_polylepis.1